MTFTTPRIAIQDVGTHDYHRSRGDLGGGTFPGPTLATSPFGN